VGGFISEANLCEWDSRVKVSKAVEHIGNEAVSSDGSLIGDEIDERASDDCAGRDGKCHPDRQPDSVAPETLIVILDCVLSEEGSVLASESRSFGPGPRIVVRRDLDNVAGHR
jgi:hypothetical protein